MENSEVLTALTERKAALWSFMQKMKPLPGLMDQMEIRGSRDEMRAFENVMNEIREME